MPKTAAKTRTNSRRVTAAAALVLMLSGVARAEIVVTALDEWSPPPETLGDYVMQPFPPDDRPLFEDVTSVPGPTGDVLFDRPLNHRRVGSGWSIWGHGYDGDLYYTMGEMELALTLPLDTGAFIVYASSNCWSYITATADDGTSLMQYTYWSDGAVDEAGDPIQSVGKRGVTTQIAETSTGYSINTWHHAAAVFAAVNDARVYIDGGSNGTSSTSVNPISEDTTYIGRRANSVVHDGVSAYGWDGYLAEIGIWNIALSDAEIAILAEGYSPLFIRPQSLIAYWSLWGNSSPEPDVVGGYDMTLNNNPTSIAHPPGINFPVRTLFTVPDIGGMITV